MEGCGLDASSSGQGPVTGSSEHSKGPLSLTILMTASHDRFCRYVHGLSTYQISGS
jgi:hypothetical protein